MWDCELEEGVGKGVRDVVRSTSTRMDDILGSGRNRRSANRDCVEVADEYGGKGSVCCSAVSRNTKRKIRRTKKRKWKELASTSEVVQATIMFWNGRGVVDKVAEMTMFMERSGVGLCMISESRNYGRDLSRGKWHWLAGSECLPALGCPTPAKGLGALVDLSRFPGTTVMKCTDNALWLRVPGELLDLYVCGVYLPCGPATDRQKALEGIAIDFKKFRALGLVLLGGDCNARCSMNGDHITDTRGRRLMEFAHEKELAIINACDSLCDGLYTREIAMVVAGNKVWHRTTIDYVMVPEGQVKCVTALTIVPDSGLVSDHKPLLLKLTWKAGPRHRPPKNDRMKWQVSDMTQGDWDWYEQLCTTRMVGWNKEFNADQSDPQTKLDCGLERFLMDLVECADEGIGKRKVGKMSKGWWNPQLGELVRRRQELLVEAGSMSGADRLVVLESLKLLGKNIKRLCRKSRREWEKKAAENIDALGHASRQFNSRWRRHMERVDARIPDAITSPEGKMVTRPDLVLKEWSNYLNAQYAEEPVDQPDNKGDLGTRFDNEFARRVLTELRARSCDDDGRTHELDAEITWSEVVSALATLPDGTSGGEDGIVGELLRKAGIGLAVAVTCLFNHMWANRMWPDAWRKAHLIPLYKREGLKTEPGNYRLLALTSVLSKSFEKVLDARLRAWAERLSAISDWQGGFRAGRGCTDQMFVLHEIMASRKEEKKQTIMAFLDVAKAYDRVWRPGLWFKLQRLGVGKKMLQMLEVMFGRVSRRVLVNDAFTDYTDLQTGVPQGAVLSPFLYAIFINGLADELQRAGLGVGVFGTVVALLLYADDIVVLASDPVEMQTMLDVVTRYAKQWRFEFNQRKCGVVTCGTALQRRNIGRATFTLGGGSIASVSKYKYLGVEMSGTRAQWNDYLDRMYTGAQLELRRLAWKSGGFRTLSITSLRHLWSSQVRPILEYAAELWEGGISVTKERKIESLQNQFAKMAIGFAKWSTPAAAGVRAEVALPTLKSRRRQSKLGFWDRLCTMNPERLVARVFRARLVQVKKGNAPLSCLQSMRVCMVESGLVAFWVQGCSRKGWKQSSALAVRNWEVERENRSISDRRSLDWFAKLGQPPGSLRPAPYLWDRNNCKGTRLLAFARLGQLFLLNKIAKMVRWPEAGTLCMLCDSLQREDIWHFIIVCPLLEPCRTKLSRELVTSMKGFGVPGKVLLEKFFRNDKSRLEVILGQEHPELVLLTGSGRVDADMNVAMLCARVRLQVDKLVKSFLVACWRVREAAIGKLRVVDGRVVVSRKGVATQLARYLADQKSGSGLGNVQAPEKEVRRWMSWPTRHTLKRVSNSKPAFYIVFRGRWTGLYYKWSDCVLAMRGWPDPLVKGFRTLEEALAAWQENTTSVVVSDIGFDENNSTRVSSPEDAELDGNLSDG